MSVFIAGAGAGVGQETVKAAIAAGLGVCAMIRNEDQRRALEALGASVVIADAFDGTATAAAITGAGHIDAVVCTLGSKPADGQRVDYEGAKSLIDGAGNAGIKRFLLVTSFGCGETRGVVPPPLLKKIGAALTEKDKAETYLTESDLAWTIVRPGGLGDDPASGTAVLTESGHVLGGINRADVAALILACLRSDKTVGKKLGANDTAKVRAGDPVPFET